jgi:hypothetical protein
MKTLTENGNMSFGTTIMSISEEVYDLFANLRAMAVLMNDFGLSWKDIRFREFPGVGPARSGGKWLYLSGKKEPGSNSSNNIYPQTGLGKLYIESFIFYTDNEKEIAAIKIGSDFKVDFAATFNKSYEEWSKEFGNKFYIL